MALPDDILTNIKDIERRVSNLERNPQPPNVNTSNDASGTFSLAAAGSSGDVLALLFTITAGDISSTVMAEPMLDIYWGAGGVAAIYPFGANWTDQMRRNLEVSIWPSIEGVIDNVTAYRIVFKNNGATPINNITIIGRYRYIMRSASLS